MEKGLSNIDIIDNHSKIAGEVSVLTLPMFMVAVLVLRTVLLVN